MPFVSAELMDRAWQRVGGMGGREIIKLQKSHQQNQKPLSLFVVSALHDYREDAGGLLLYLYQVVLYAFQKAEPRPKRVSKRQLDEAIGELASEATLEAYRAGSLSPREPHVLRYVYEAFTESAEDDDVVLSQHELESFFSMMYVVAECLHEACER